MVKVFYTQGTELTTTVISKSKNSHFIPQNLKCFMTVVGNGLFFPGHHVQRSKADTKKRTGKSLLRPFLLLLYNERT